VSADGVLGRMEYSNWTEEVRVKDRGGGRIRCLIEWRMDQLVSG